MGELFCAITASSGAAAGGIIYFVSYLPFSFFGDNARYPSLSANAKFGLSVVPNLAMGIGCKTLGQFESTGVFDFITSIFVLGKCRPIMHMQSCLQHGFPVLCPLSLMATLAKDLFFFSAIQSGMGNLFTQNLRVLHTIYTFNRRVKTKPFTQ